MSDSGEPPLPDHWNVERENLLVLKFYSILNFSLSNVFIWWPKLVYLSKMERPENWICSCKQTKTLVVWHLFVQFHSDTGWFSYQFPLTICEQFVHNLCKAFHNFSIIFVHNFVQQIVHNFFQHIVHTLFPTQYGIGRRLREVGKGYVLKLFQISKYWKY